MIDFAWDGLRAALARLDAAEGRLRRCEGRAHRDASRQAETAGLIASSEALWWACAIDEALGHVDADRLRAARFARNRIAHQLAAASRATPGGVNEPKNDSVNEPPPRLVWVAADRLPPPTRFERKMGRDECYDAVFAGCDALEGLRAVDAALVSAAAREP